MAFVVHWTKEYLGLRNCNFVNRIDRDETDTEIFCFIWFEASHVHSYLKKDVRFQYMILSFTVNYWITVNVLFILWVEKPIHVPGIA